MLELLTEENILALKKSEIKEFISDAEKALMAYEGEKLEIEPKHHFSKGVYAREILIPKGAIVVGKIHKHENLNILSKGKLLLLSIDGGMIVEAPYTVVSSPGVKRLALALEDSIWTTIHGTDETDVEIIENEFIAKSYDEVEELCPGSQLESVEQVPLQIT